MHRRPNNTSTNIAEAHCHDRHHGSVLDHRVSTPISSQSPPRSHLEATMMALFRYLSPNSLSTMTRIDKTIIPVSTSPVTCALDVAVANSDSVAADSNQRTRNQFRPRVGKGGATSYQLRQYAEVTLGGGSLRKVVKLPEGEDENEWLAVNSKRCDAGYPGRCGD